MAYDFEAYDEHDGDDMELEEVETQEVQVETLKVEIAKLTGIIKVNVEADMKDDESISYIKRLRDRVTDCRKQIDDLQPADTKIDTLRANISKMDSDIVTHGETAARQRERAAKEIEKAEGWEAKVVALKAEVLILNANLRDLLTNQGAEIIKTKRAVMDPNIIAYIKCFPKTRLNIKSV